MMRGLRSFILACTMTIMTAQPVMAGTMYAEEDVNIRKAPGFHGEIVDVLKEGEAVEVLMTVDRERSWSIVETEDGLRAICADYLTEEEPKPAMHLWGVATVTYYDWGPCCCGQWAYGPTASGVNPTVNHTVACGDLPFGTRIMINGVEYTVEDRGVSGMWVDIFVGSHEEALQRGMHQAEVWIIDD